MKVKYLKPLLLQAPSAWAVIRALEAEVLEQFSFRPPILEIGCGDGIFSQVLFAKKGAVDVGIDIHKQELERASKTGVYKHLILTSATDIPLKAQSQRTVFSNGVLEHILELEKVLAEVSRVLIPRGHLIFTCPTSRLTQNLMGYSLLKNIGCSRCAAAYGRMVNGMFRHHNLYDVPTWRRFLKRHGLHIVSVRHYNPKRTTRTHELLLPFAFPSAVTKRFADRQVLFKSVRSVAVTRILVPLLRRLETADQNSTAQSSVAIDAVKL
ncbi:MAG: hypothetical protein A3A65_00525 [Candidatus Chisholmbacteria bacterium RIFCSPLOWO2_01_FULL_49_14]|uniref:Methyltransferase type 11 domain-containing protein n=1 Tax=Candidatus Chisholmbacteria bacterium RIFCSPLOWO2_01_FULL_49_14 TaxID=1797593 RepID=A0A1G1VZ26_9BACT|nr:MAG: hypothetical protein A3A65_00525 [Candidatus Chisholmbacteria bacterium RIFCSPLOWO2_01_FULL_49_14]